jgi:hypothetical protein
MLGGTGHADATTDTLIRYLAAEVGPHGARTVPVAATGVGGRRRGTRGSQAHSRCMLRMSRGEPLIA